MRDFIGSNVLVQYVITGNADHNAGNKSTTANDIQ